jgi:hypothetical protein
MCDGFVKLYWISFEGGDRVIRGVCYSCKRIFDQDDRSVNGKSCDTLPWGDRFITVKQLMLMGGKIIETVSEENDALPVTVNVSGKGWYFVKSFYN